MSKTRTLLVLGLLLLIGSFKVQADTFDIQLYDTYYVIGWGILLRSVGLVCCLIAGIYFLQNRPVR
ncbi:hypothetical protein [Spirosoma koreense]